MRPHENLLEQERNKRRSTADALDVMCRFAGFGAQDQAEIRVGLLRLPSSTIVGIVLVMFDSPIHHKVYIVSLPTSTHFRAIREGSSQREKVDISLLDGAAVAADGTARLTDGARLRAVEVVPARLPKEPSELDWRIVHHAIPIAGAEGRCYRSLRHGLPPDQQAMVPDLRFLDCGTLPGLHVPCLKVIAGRVADRAPDLAEPSCQKIADALRDFGIRTPNARRHK
jgi:hypothetical protein